jgi:hypothetical protein
VSRWQIIDGPHQHEAHQIDGELWLATIGNVNDPAQRRIIGAVLSRTVLDSDQSTLPIDVRLAVASQGRRAIERFLDEPDLPARIIVSSTAILPSDESP